MKKGFFILWLFLFLQTIPGFAQMPVDVIASGDYKMYVYHAEGKPDYRFIGKAFSFQNNGDSTLVETSELIRDPATGEYIRNGWLYSHEENTVENKSFYVLGRKHYTKGSDEGYYLGNLYSKVPLLQMKNPEHKPDNFFSRATTEPYMLMLPPDDGCITLNQFDLKFSRSKGCEGSVTWWLPNLLTSQNDDYPYAAGWEFEMDFVPTRSDEGYPIQIPLGNSPQGYYYVTIDKNGKTALGENSDDGFRDVLTVSKATHIEWGQENHLKVQFLTNGNYVIEINDYKQSSAFLNLESKVFAPDSTVNTSLSNYWGISNRLLLKTGLRIQYLYLGMLHFIPEKEIIPAFNGLYQADAVRLSNIIIGKLFTASEGEFIASDPYLISFLPANGDETENTVNMAVNVEFMVKGERRYKAMWFKFRLDKDSNKIVKIDGLIGGQRVIWSAKEFFDQFLDKKATNGYRLENNLLTHNNSR